ncbi:nuclease-related domain-containing protein [Streptomyces sp. NPDC093225]|uniref:nuclease-related domain-containing protein n=1 Tax=Streptomyces sp. NPDC093225 TaxID=3366034 RepID=UPI00380BC99A
MSGLRVVPGRLHGGHRLWVSLPDGRTVGWYDREAGRVNLVDAAQRDAVLAALGPYLVGAYTVGPPPVPTPAELARLALHPDDDLAPNRPGEPLLGELAYGAPGRRSRGLRHDLLAQQRFGAELDALEGLGWRVLHAVPLPGTGAPAGPAQIDHLLIGPGGVFAVRTAAGRRQRVSVGDLLLSVGRSEPRPEPRWVRRAAEQAAHALTVAVTPVLAVVDAARVTVAPTLRDVRVLREGEAGVLGQSGGVLKPADVDGLHAMARDRRTWSTV